MSAEPDVGAADPALLAALEAGDEPAIKAALHSARLLVAVVALPGAEQASEGEMALALLESSDGKQALPAFTGLAALADWSADARPVPRPADEVVAYARAESLAAVVLDPGSTHAWTMWRTEFAADGEVVGEDPQENEGSESSYSAPTWRPTRKARRAAAGHEVYALDAGSGEPAVAVICPEGTLDADWARRLLELCPEGTAVLALPPSAQPAIEQLGRRL